MDLDRCPGRCALICLACHTSQQSDPHCLTSRGCMICSFGHRKAAPVKLMVQDPRSSELSLRSWACWRKITPSCPFIQGFSHGFGRSRRVPVFPEMFPQKLREIFFLQLRIMRMQILTDCQARGWVVLLNTLVLVVWAAANWTPFVFKRSDLCASSHVRAYRRREAASGLHT